jgi:deoxyadenosine/deoxycytidine kinase
MKETEKPYLLCLSGCLCAGKTTLAEDIMRTGISACLLKENLAEHLIYRELQSGRAGWLETQLEFYVRWGQLICSTGTNPGDTVAVDHSIDVHHNVYSRVAYDLHRISDNEWRVLCGAYEAFRAFTASRFSIKNLVLKVSVDTLASRMQQRMRDGGDEMHSEFLQAQRERFDSWAKNQEAAMVLEEYELSPGLSDNVILQGRIQRFIKHGKAESK